MNQDQIKQFESLAKPLMEWLKENSCQKTVVMTSDICHLLNPQTTIERQFNFYDDPNQYVEELVLKNTSIEKENLKEMATAHGCETCTRRDFCKMQDECNEQNGFPLFEDFPF